MNLEGLGPIDWEELVSLPTDYWRDDAKEVRKFLEEQVKRDLKVKGWQIIFQVGSDLPEKIRNEMEGQEKRINAL